jgi:hypothetical protein
MAHYRQSLRDGRKMQTQLGLPIPEIDLSAIRNAPLAMRRPVSTPPAKTS